MLNSSKKLSFSEFPPVSTEQWEKVVERDLKGADYKQKLQWKTGEGINPLPFYRREHLTTLLHDSVPFRKTNEWKIRELITEDNIEDARVHAFKALKNNVDELLFDMPAATVRDQKDVAKLMEGLITGKTGLHFGKHMVTKDLPKKVLLELKDAKISPSDIPVSFALDPYALAVLTGKLINTREWEYILKELPAELRSMGVNADVYGNLGATITEQLAYALATGNEYLGFAEELGLTYAQAAKDIHFNFASGSGYFPELAKIRAFRLLWERILEEYEPGLSQSVPAYIHTETSAWNKSVYDAHNNLLRATTEAMSAALGGADTITVRPFDDINAEPTDFSLRIARNIQHLLKEESYLDKVADPGAGSYYIEVLTEQIADESWKLFREIEAQGGFGKCVHDGIVQSQIRASQSQKRQAVATRRTTIVGVNNYPAPFTENIRTQAVNNTEFGCTPTYSHDVEMVKPSRAASDFENLRNDVEMQVNIPKVQLIPFGDVKMRKARSMFSLNFFASAGFTVEDHNGFGDLDSALDYIKSQMPDVVVLCSSDEEYKTWVAPFCDAVKIFKSRPLIVLAGYPKDDIEEYTKAGINEFIHVRSNMLDVLTKIHQILEVA